MGHHLVTEEIPMTPGKYAWAVSVMNCQLPTGLPHRTPVQIVRNDVGDTQIHVVDANGTPWSLNRRCLLPRVRYRSRSGTETGAKAYLEHTDEAQNLLSHEIGHLERELEETKAQIEKLYWAVRRSKNRPAIDRLEERLADHNPLGDFQPEIPGDANPGY